MSQKSFAVHNSRTVRVDPTGGWGDFRTIKEACDWVTAHGSPSTTNRWLIEVYPNPAGPYSELPFSTPDGSHVMGMMSKPGGNAAQGVQIAFNGTWLGGAFITLGAASHLANLGISAAVDASASSEAILISASTGRVNFCQLQLTNNSSQITSIIKGAMQVEGCALTPIGNNVRALYITGSSAVRFCQIFSNGGTDTYGIYHTSGTSTFFFIRLGGSGANDPDFATDIARIGGSLRVNNINYKTYSGGGSITHADRYWNTNSSLREAPAATEIPLQLKGAASQSAAIEVDLNSSGAIINQRVIHAGGENVFNETGLDIDFRIEGDTDTGLFFVDASADRVGIGTNAPTQKLDINSDSVRIRTAKTPANATDTGTQGQVAWDADYIYVCVATNTWKRSALATW